MVQSKSLLSTFFLAITMVVLGSCATPRETETLVPINVPIAPLEKEELQAEPEPIEELPQLPEHLIDIERLSPFFQVLQRDEQLVYILGTIHLGDGDGYQLGSDILASLANSDLVALELSPEELSNSQSYMADFILEAELPEDTLLEQLINPEHFETLMATIAPDSFTRQFYNQYQPWIAQMVFDATIQIESGLDPNSGIEYLVIEEAQKADKLIVGLETFEQQIDAFRDWTIEEQAQMLSLSIEQIDEARATGIELVDLYKNGEQDAMALLLLELDDSSDLEQAYLERLLIARNYTMANSIELLLQEGYESLFVAVGAGHTLGGESLGRILMDQGFTDLFSDTSQ